MKSYAHSFTLRICHWEYCRYCGLVALRNDATRRAMKRRCPGLEDD